MACKQQIIVRRFDGLVVKRLGKSCHRPLASVWSGLIDLKDAVSLISCSLVNIKLLDTYAFEFIFN
jgi:hypothetical protein